jgi:hypothetical protein
MEKRAMRRKSITQTYEMRGKLEAQREKYREDLAERDRQTLSKEEELNEVIELLTADLLEANKQQVALTKAKKQEGGS